MEDRDMTRREGDEDVTLGDMDPVRKSESGGAKPGEDVESGVEDEDAVVRKEEYGTRPA